MQEHALALLVHRGAPPPSWQVSHELLAGQVVHFDVEYDGGAASAVWSKQRSLAWVVARIAAGRRPMWADAERLGQKLYDFIGRYS